MAEPLEHPVEILLVEDNEADVFLAREAFKQVQTSNHLEVVGDGDAALAHLRRPGAMRPDLILLDLNLPRRNGREVLAELKADPSLSSIPVVVLSSSRCEDDVLAVYQLHGNSYVVKPIDLDHYIAAMGAIEAFWLRAARLPGTRDN